MDEQHLSSQTAPDLGMSIEHMPYGVAVFDSDLALVMANAIFRAGLGLPAPLVARGTPLDDILLFIARRGDLGPGTPQVLADQRRRLITSEPVTLTQRKNVSGSQLEIHTSMAPGKGLVI